MDANSRRLRYFVRARLVARPRRRFETKDKDYRLTISHGLLQLEGQYGLRA